MLKAYVLYENDVRSIVNSLVMHPKTKELFYKMVLNMGVSLTEYMYEVLNVYMLHYVNKEYCNDDRRLIIDNIDRLQYKLNNKKTNIKVLDPLDILYNVFNVELYGVFDTCYYEDIFNSIESVTNDPHEYFDEIVNVVTTIVNYIECCYINYGNIENTAVKILLAYKDNRLMIFTDDSSSIR